MKQPYYELDESTRHITLELLNKAKELDLGIDGSIAYDYSEKV